MRKRKILEKDGANRWKTGCFIAALVAALAVFFVMLGLEKSVLSDYERGEVYVAVKPIPRGYRLNMEEIFEYLEVRGMDVALIPETAVKNPEELMTLVPCYEIETGTVITSGMFTDMEEELKSMKDPVIAGLKADDLYQVAGGLIRAGDRIHVYRVDEENEAKPVWENLYVQSVFDQSGTLITGSDKTSSAHRMNVYLDKEDIAFFYSELAKGTLRVVKDYELK